MEKVTDNGNDLSLTFSHGNKETVIHGDVYHTTEREVDYNDVVFDLSYAPTISWTITLGGNDADTFKFVDSGDGTDTIKDFKASQGDALEYLGFRPINNG